MRRPNYEEDGPELVDPPVDQRGLTICEECLSPLDEDDECSNPDCELHPSHGGWRPSNGCEGIYLRNE